jgi:hypothetical protein
MITVNEALKDSIREIDQMIEERLGVTRAMLASRGATVEEIESIMEQYIRDLATWREQQLRRLRQWLQRGGEVVH